MVAIFKARAVMVNVNYRYVENELEYIFENSDMVALIDERHYIDKVANVLPSTPLVKTVIVVEDGTDLDYSSYGASNSRRRWPQGSPERDFGSAPRRHLHALHRRHHRHAQGRDVAAGGRVAGARRRYRLRHR